MKIIRRIALMFASAIVALLLHPLLYIIGYKFYSEYPSIILHFVLTYTIVGSLIWCFCDKKVWWKQGLLILVGVNLILGIILICFMRGEVKDAMTALMILTASFFDCCLSFVPIALCCYFNSNYFGDAKNET
jgi:hypothetical protein